MSTNHSDHADHHHDDIAGMIHINPKNCQGANETPQGVQESIDDSSHPSISEIMQSSSREEKQQPHTNIRSVGSSSRTRPRKYQLTKTRRQYRSRLPTTMCFSSHQNDQQDGPSPFSSGNAAAQSMWYYYHQSSSESGRINIVARRRRHLGKNDNIMTNHDHKNQIETPRGRWLDHYCVEPFPRPVPDSMMTNSEEEVNRRQEGDVCCLGIPVLQHVAQERTRTITPQQRRLRIVRFSTPPDIGCNDLNSHFSTEEARKMWYQQSELKRMKIAAREFSLGNNQECEEEPRGLEAVGNWKRYKNKKLAIKCVVMASREWKLNPENLAKIARRVSERAVEAAWVMGVRDCVVAPSQT
jgi:hypothetical protein